MNVLFDWVCEYNILYNREMTIREQKREGRQQQQQQHQHGGGRVIFNVSGEKYETYEETLSRFPTTLLGDRSKRCMYYNDITKEHYFDRHRLCFDSILFFYQSNGSLNCPTHVQISVFETECTFFQLPAQDIKKAKRKAGIILREVATPVAVKKPAVCLYTKLFQSNLLERPDTSLVAWCLWIFSLVMIVLSVAVAFLDTVPRLHAAQSFWFLEVVLHVWFLVEIMLRWIFSANKLGFLFGLLNLIDIVTVIPFFLSLALRQEVHSYLCFFKMLKFVRVIRLLRMSHNSTRLQVVGLFLKTRLRTYTFLVLCYTIVTFIGGVTMYYIEYLFQGNRSFSSIPQGLWWSVQTITLVGYGDVIPDTVAGKVKTYIHSFQKSFFHCRFYNSILCSKLFFRSDR